MSMTKFTTTGGDASYTFMHHPGTMRERLRRSYRRMLEFCVWISSMVLEIIYRLHFLFAIPKIVNR